MAREHVEKVLIDKKIEQTLFDYWKKRQDQDIQEVQDEEDERRQMEMEVNKDGHAVGQAITPDDDQQTAPDASTQENEN